MKKLFIFVLILTLISGLNLLAKDKPIVKKGAKTITMKGTLRHWSDVEKISLDQVMGPRKMRPIMNFDDPRRIVKQDATADPVEQKSFGLTRGTKAVSSPIKSFSGMNLTSNGSGWPPDTTGDVGSTYFVQAVNSSMAIYNKSTGTLVSATTFDNFFGGSGISGTPCDSENNGDPLVLYDRYNQRWFVLDFAWDSSQNDGSYFSIAASQTSDPTGSWYQYAFRANNTLMDDYPKAGVWHDGIYITANMFNFSNSSYQYTQIWAIKTPGIYTGTMTSQTVTDSGDQAFSIMPSNSKGSSPPSSSAPNYMYSVDASEFGTGHSDALYVWKYDVDWTNSSNTTWTGPSSMSTASYDLTASGIPQSGSSKSLDSLYGRLMYTAFYRKFATYESVLLCHVAEASSSVRAMRWYEIRISGGSSSIYQQGTYAPDSNHRWMGSVASDKNGSIALAYSKSSSSMYPAIAYTGRLVGDTLNQMPQGEETLIAGGGAQSSYTRWGDYSTLTIDPDDDETFWYTPEYYTSTGTNWNTRIGSFKIPTSGDTTPPVISSISAGSISQTGATITWTTDESADSEVNYGTTSSYGSTETSASLVTSHSISLTGLTAETTYHYSVQSSDSSSNTSTSTDYTFTTLADSSGGDDIAEAVDQDSFTFTQSGDADWTKDTSIYYYGSDSAKSGSITHNQTSSIETSISYSAAKTVSFYWKVSSESNYDYLRFYIDDVLQEQIAGTVDWTQKSYDVASGSHTLKWTYYKDGSVSSNSDCGWVDRLQFEDIVIPSDPIAAALDTTGTYTLSGDEDWAVTTSSSYYGGSSVVSPSALNNSEDCTVQTTVSGVTSISFYWKVSSEARYDYLKFYIDDVLQDQIAGTTSWAQKTYSVSSGSHTIKWVYDKDYSVSSGSDCGWVDKVELD
ncbi:MAG: hypothetical protein GY757_12035 [bacterium]|nr:hypothetical protein [bacterium]